MAETSGYRARKVSDAVPGDVGATGEGTLATEPLIGPDGGERGDWAEWIGLFGFALIAWGVGWAAVWTVRRLLLGQEDRGQQKLGAIGTFAAIAALIAVGVWIRAAIE